jgi:hypothetical protein
MTKNNLENNTAKPEEAVVIIRVSMRRERLYGRRGLNVSM